MAPHDLPDLSQSLGPAFGPIVVILWNVVGVPVFELLLLLYSAPALSQAVQHMGQAAATAVAEVLPIAVVLASAVVAVVAVVVVILLLLGTTAVAAFWRRRE